MSETQPHPEELRASGRLILPSLGMSRLATQPPLILTMLLLIDIGLTFDRPVGVMAQITTAASLVSAISAVLMGAWSIRYNHKSLLLTGLLFLSFSALGCAFALNFTMMLIAYSLSGLGTAIIGPMCLTQVAAHFPLEKRANAIGWINAGMPLSFIIGSPIMGVIAGVGGWRWTALGFMLPVSLLSLLLAAKGLPSTSRTNQHTMSERNIIEGFKVVFSNRSATACLVGSMFFMAGWQAILVYCASFFRERFQISTGFASIVVLIAALSVFLGMIVGGRIVNWFGMKPVTVLTVFFAGIFIISYMNVPNFWLAVAFMALGCIFTGMMITASSSLTLEQVPRFRGTTMSMYSAAWSLGGALGAGVGGFMLFLRDYGVLGLVLGAMMLASAIIFYLLAIDPTSTESNM